MTLIFEAVYENGALKPDKPLPLDEHQRVVVTVEERRPSLAERLAALALQAPPEVVDAWPTDGASQHDHYIYGAPKRSE